MCRELTTIEHNELLQKRSLKRSMVVLLMIEGNCLTFRAKPAHLVGHLPDALCGKCAECSTESVPMIDFYVQGSIKDR
jgi:hypothetical protein